MQNNFSKEKFPDRVSLQAFFRDQLFFESSAKWLYPLFDLEDEIKLRNIDLSKAVVRDKVVGKAAALFLVYLDVGYVHGKLMSDLAVIVLQRNNLPFSFGYCVPRIKCKTEELLLMVDDPEVAHEILLEGANRM